VHRSWSIQTFIGSLLPLVLGTARRGDRCVGGVGVDADGNDAPAALSNTDGGGGLVSATHDYRRPRARIAASPPAAQAYQPEADT
jgi:hypothetical protein